MDAGACADGPGVAIGVTGEPTGLEFDPLAKGGDIPLETFGQGGTHAALAIRTIGFGKQAFVDVTLENLDTGKMVHTVPSSRPQLLLCRGGKTCVCDLLPLNVMTGGLAECAKKDGLAVRVTAKVRNKDGLMGEASQEGVLRKAYKGACPGAP
jgi:hypothetical protein